MKRRNGNKKMKMPVDEFNNKEGTIDAKQFMRTVELPRP